MPSEYRVGYGKPPRHTRFRRGESGNPKGRPRHAKNLKTDLVEELRESILVREGSRERRVSKQRALLKSLLAQAIKGDARASTVLVNMILRVLGVEPDERNEPPLSAEEREVLETLERRLERTTRPRRPRGEGTGRGRRRARVVRS